MMSRIRTISLLVVLTVLAASCERMSVGPEIAGELHRGRAYAAALEQRTRSTPAESVSAVAAISLGYLERQRLGLGSPFRLIDYLTRDARLPDSTRRAVAWAILARTLDGDGVQVSALALDSLASPAARTAANDGAMHLRLIDHAVRETHDPRAGELAVRLAYMVEAAEHNLRADAPRVAADVAAVLRDRQLAQADARDLLRAGWRNDTDPLAMISVWRETHRFRVERPVMERLDRDAQLEAMELVPKLTENLRELATRVDSAGGGAGPLPAAPDSSTLAFGAAERLAGLARISGMPPEAPVVVQLERYRHELLDGQLDTWRRNARARFVRHSRDEESFAAEHAIVEEQAPGTTPARSALATAVALRAYAQERPWLPGDGGPTASDLADRFGIRSVTFDADVPDGWKPYYRAMLATALEDMERVLPALDLDGLRIHFGESPMGSAALALHDPKRRTIYLPVATSAGTIAHELAHDIDWQAALSRYAVRGDYATDRAVRDAHGGAIAASMRGLTAASRLSAAVRGRGQVVSSRPTEVFARNVDWFVASALAREGRMDGYLSSAQDDFLTGYALGTPPDAAGHSVPALVSILDAVAPPAPLVREWFVTRYGPGRAVTPYDLVRRVLDAPLDSAGASLVDLVAPVLRARDAALAAVAGGRCRSGALEDARTTRARRDLVVLAASARAAGIMRVRGTVLAIDEARRWLAVAPYSAAEPFVLAGGLAASGQVALAERAIALDSVSETIPAPTDPRCEVRDAGRGAPGA
ncbi:MAG TPA: hypothetical protein VFS44_05470 [Gemmatimonadaceae bacterium]|nr:hypothetical protein [Gemmatimonadaceae bacterium]